MRLDDNRWQCYTNRHFLYNGFNTMTQDSQHLIWIDLEMTGLNPDTDLIIEIATIVTDKDLNILAQGPVIAVHQSDAALAAMDDWNQLHHGQSGLIERVKASTVDDAEAERLTIEFLKDWVPANTSPICGNSIGQDRRFLVRYMPKLEAYFHYRNIDVSTLKELAARWAPALKDGFKKETKHQALDDIIESIEELRYYREHFIKF
jgi:oligoribonuclease